MKLLVTVTRENKKTFTTVAVDILNSIRNCHVPVDQTIRLMSTRPAPAPEPPFLKSAGIRSSTSSFKIKSSPHSGTEPAFQCQLPTDKCSNFNALQLTLFRKIKIKFF